MYLSLPPFWLSSLICFILQEIEILKSSSTALGNVSLPFNCIIAVSQIKLHTGNEILIHDQQFTKMPQCPYAVFSFRASSNKTDFIFCAYWE